MTCLQTVTLCNNKNLYLDKTEMNALETRATQIALLRTYSEGSAEENRGHWGYFCSVNQLRVNDSAPVAHKVRCGLLLIQLCLYSLSPART